MKAADWLKAIEREQIALMTMTAKHVEELMARQRTLDEMIHRAIEDIRADLTPETDQ